MSKPALRSAVSRHASSCQDIVGKQKMENNISENVKTSENAQNVCLHNKHGYCKFRNLCRFHHVEEICFDNSCDVERCVRRHPKVCSYYREFKYCKFGSYCSYLHKKTDVDTTKIIQLQEQSTLGDDFKALSKLVEDNCREIRSVRDELMIYPHQLQTKVL